AGLVDQDGNAASAQPASVLTGATNTKVFQLDRPGAIDVTFQTKVPGQTNPVSSSADSIMVFNTGMTTAEQFGTVGTRVPKVTAHPRFPFSSPDPVYAGSCTGNLPPATTPLSALASATVNPGGPTTTVRVTLPALDVTVSTGSKSNNPGSVVNGAKIVL